MRRLTAILSILLFFIWCLPLGAFIRPEKEKEACNGRRAICLCTHLIKKQQNRQTVKVFWKNAHQTQKELSGSSSHDFYRPAVNFQVIPDSGDLFPEPLTAYSQLVIRPLDHVPKTDSA